MKSETSKAIEEFVRKYGESKLVDVLSPNRQEDILTIIANADVHPYHALHKRGEIFVASEGSLDFSTEESAVSEIESVLLRVAKKLKEKRWSCVYLVPFGPAPLALQIKSLVHKILDVETIDVLHIGNGAHIDIHINPRSIAARIKSEL
ncbi:hypothetical protein C8R26_10864 [Nitrosomonas oligotropha]|uniref:SMODS-associated and fused to various effectors domain-containing protein n=1 Tax=Nitrosomonas oligotropha TaxID=42354 RepID=A0A2T5I0Z2_9PROT|nr:hypothetical protein [Nitrosomonas oligotropha]PTQ77418.1 hypothetical protein C8R26_10864 [Nitrosomonas oligotropha]